MLDITGDAVLDHLDDRRNAVFGFLNRNPIAVPVAAGGLSPLSALINGPISGDLGHSDRSGWTVEGNLNIGGVFGGSIGYTRTNTTDDRVVSDMDGDGFIDLVSIVDGRVQVRRGIGENRFEATPTEWTTQIPASELVSSRSERNHSAADQIHPVDPLVKWIAPFTGTVDVTARSRRKKPAATASRHKSFTTVSRFGSTRSLPTSSAIACRDRVTAAPEDFRFRSLPASGCT